MAEIGRQTEIHTARQPDPHAEIDTARQTDRQPDSQTESRPKGRSVRSTGGNEGSRPDREERRGRETVRDRDGGGWENK